MAFGAFDLLEGLDVLMLGAVHDGKNFRDEMGFIARPMTTCASVQRFHYNTRHRHRDSKLKLIRGNHE